MKILGRSPKTTLVGLFGTLIVVCTLILLFIEKIDANEMITIWSGVGVMLAILNSYFSKDSDVTHSDYYSKKVKSADIPDPDKEQK